MKPVIERGVWPCPQDGEACVNEACNHGMSCCAPVEDDEPSMDGIEQEFRQLSEDRQQQDNS